jgi:hypothetical protein
MLDDQGESLIASLLAALRSLVDTLASWIMQLKGMRS